MWGHRKRGVAAAVGPRRLIVGGLLLGCVGMAFLTRLHAGSGYFAHVLPALVIIGLAFGLVVPPSLNTATANGDFRDSGVASAMVSTM
jgi:hypothetical protein